jgi:hypothetical protein
MRSTRRWYFVQVVLLIGLATSSVPRIWSGPDTVMMETDLQTATELIINTQILSSVAAYADGCDQRDLSMTDNTTMANLTSTVASDIPMCLDLLHAAVAASITPTAAAAATTSSKLGRRICNGGKICATSTKTNCSIEYRKRISNIRCLSPGGKNACRERFRRVLRNCTAHICKTFNNVNVTNVPPCDGGKLWCTMSDASYEYGCSYACLESYENRQCYVRSGLLYQIIWQLGFNASVIQNTSTRIIRCGFNDVLCLAQALRNQTMASQSVMYYYPSNKTNEWTLTLPTLPATPSPIDSQAFRRLLLVASGVLALVGIVLLFYYLDCREVSLVVVIDRLTRRNGYDQRSQRQQPQQQPQRQPQRCRRGKNDSASCSRMLGSNLASSQVVPYNESNIALF